jgi:hypothetical protein
MSKNQRCENCVYWKDELYCQRYPPVIVKLAGEGTSLFPETFPEWWCGEHKPKKASDVNG